jgi:ferritin-like metal-binding protein YciE
MNTSIKSLTDALAYILQELYYAETKLIEELPRYYSRVTSIRLNQEIEKYTRSSNNKLLKLERVFNYLGKENLSRPNEAINGLLTEIHKVLTATTSTHLRDILCIACIQTVNAYKIAGYRSAYLFAVELELDTATDMIREMLDWEIQTCKILAVIAAEEFNKQAPA